MKTTYKFYIFFAFLLIIPVVQADSETYWNDRTAKPSGGKITSTVHTNSITYWNDRSAGSSRDNNSSPTPDDFRDIERISNSDTNTDQKRRHDASK